MQIGNTKKDTQSIVGWNMTGVQEKRL